MRKFRIAMIGAGNVATHLARALATHHKISFVWSKTHQNAKILGTTLNTAYSTQLSDIPADCDLCLVAVHDDYVSEIFKDLSKFSGVIAHTSGSTPLLPSSITAISGVFYPLQTFTKHDALDLCSVPFCIESNIVEVEELLFNLASSISNDVSKVNTDQRKKLHVAAVFACNFTNHMYTIAETLLNEHALSLDLLKPLIRETTSKISKNSPANLQTGPAKRNDINVMKSHIEQLRGHEGFQNIYNLVSKNIQEHSN